VGGVIFILIIVSFALLYFFFSVYLFIAPLFWGEINALPLNYSLGAKFRHLVVKIALLFVLSIIFPNLLPSLLLHFFLSIYPWSTWFPWGQINDIIIGLQISHHHYNKMYILFKSIFKWGGGVSGQTVFSFHVIEFPHYYSGF